MVTLEERYVSSLEKKGGIAWKGVGKLGCLCPSCGKGTVTLLQTGPGIFEVTADCRCDKGGIKVLLQERVLPAKVREARARLREEKPPGHSDREAPRLRREDRQGPGNGVLPADVDPKEALRVGWIDGAVLMGKEFPALRWAIEGILPEGLTLFAGPSKAHKSWLAVDLCLAVAAGGKLFGHLQAQQGEVFYAALEDSERRLQGRFRTVLQGQPMPAGITATTRAFRIGQGLEAQLKLWLAEHENALLIVLDVLQKVRPPKKPGIQEYEQDYEALTTLHQLANERRIAIVILHHTRKAVAEDPYDMISGSVALQGVPDTLLALMKARDDIDATLHYTGRDVIGDALAIQWSASDCGWRLLGKARDHLLSAEKTALFDFLVTQTEPIGPKEAAVMIKKDPAAIRQLMHRLSGSGELKKVQYGKYEMTPMQKENWRQKAIFDAPSGEE
jgi:hypothetical protein